MKAPIVHGMPGIEQRFVDLIDSEGLNGDKLFSKKIMKLYAFVKVNMPSEYARLKTKLKGKVNLQDFEKAVRYESLKNDINEYKSGNQLLKLGYIRLNGAVMPSGWNVTMEHGVLKEAHSKDGGTMTVVC